MFMIIGDQDSRNTYNKDQNRSHGRAPTDFDGDYKIERLCEDPYGRHECHRNDS